MVHLQMKNIVVIMKLLHKLLLLKLQTNNQVTKKREKIKTTIETDENVNFEDVNNIQIQQTRIILK
jgi:hypothetical protein